MQKIGNIAERHVFATAHTESPIEIKMFNEMMRRKEFVLCRENDNPVGEGMFLFPQMQVGMYRADFLIRAIGYPSGLKVWPPKFQTTIAVECDGKDWHSSKEQIEYDKKRDAFFLEHGIRTLRYSGSEINKHVGFCVDEIISKINGFMHDDYRSENE